MRWYWGIKETRLSESKTLQRVSVSPDFKGRKWADDTYALIKIDVTLMM